MEETSMRRYLLVLVVLLAGSVLCTASAQETAISIPILNPGFEDDVLACAGGVVYCYEFSITGWLCGPSTSVFKPSTAQFPGGVPGGVNIAMIGGSYASGDVIAASGSILQTLGATVQANTTYVLRLSVGARADAAFAGYVAALMAGNVTLASDSSLAPAAGTFLTDVIVYKSGANPPQLGQPLTIFIKSKGTTGGVAVDNVSLYATPTS
jgi:hypothetical protein